MIIKRNINKNIHNAYDVAKIMRSILQAESKIDQEKEHFWVLGLNTLNSIKYIELCSLGILDKNIIHPREIFRLAIIQAVKSIIIVHNHPSGNLTPSAKDKVLTEKIKQAGKILNIPLLDHIIISLETTDFYSFAG